MNYISIKDCQRIVLAISTAFLSFISLIESQPTQSTTPPIANLRDGLYTYCNLPENAPKNLFAKCFTFKKTRNYVVGFYYPDRSDFEEICVEGTIKRNTVNGFALESVEVQPLSTYMRSAQGGNLVNWDDKEYLKVASRRVILQFPETSFVSGWVRFNRASLNLHQFYRWNSHGSEVAARCTIKEIENIYQK